MADDGFGGAKGFAPRGHGINFGGVDEVDATRERAIQDGMRERLVHLLAKRHGAQANGSDVQIALTQANGGEVW